MLGCVAALLLAVARSEWCVQGLCSARVKPMPNFGNPMFKRREREGSVGAGERARETLADVL